MLSAITFRTWGELLDHCYALAQDVSEDFYLDASYMADLLSAYKTPRGDAWHVTRKAVETAAEEATRIY